MVFVGADMRERADVPTFASAACPAEDCPAGGCAMAGDQVAGAGRGGGSGRPITGKLWCDDDAAARGAGSANAHRIRRVDGRPTTGRC